MQETRWKGKGAKMIGAAESRFKIFWQGHKNGNAGVGVIVANKWVDKVVEVNRVNEHMMAVKLIVGKRLMNIISAYAPQIGRSEEEKDVFWDKMMDLTTAIPEDEAVILGGDLNGHVGDSVDGYDGVHGGFGFGKRNLEGERILEFGDAVDMVVCNTLFKKEASKLVTYKSGGAESTIDYLMMRRRDRGEIRNVKVIPGEECVSQHRLVVGDLLPGGLRQNRRSYMKRLRVWKLKQEISRTEFAETLTSSTKQVSEAIDVNAKWDTIKNVLLKSTEKVCGFTKGPARHKETWWWNEEVRKVIEEKRRCYKVWHETKTEVDKMVYKTAKQNARRAVAIAQETQRREFARELDTEEGKKNVFRIAKQMANERQDVVGVNCLKDSAGKVVIDSKGIKKTWKDYMEKLMNEENDWDKDVLCDKTEGPCCKISSEEVEKAIKKMKIGKAAGPSGVVSEMIKAADGIGVAWLTDLCNSIVKEGRIPEDWKNSLLVPVYKGKGDPLECGSYRGIKLLEQAMKVIERVFETRIRKQVKVNDMQFGFMPGKGTTDAIFVVRQMQERHYEKRKKLYFAFVDLEKAFDRVPREVTRWALRKAGVEEWLVSAVMSMYEGARTAVRTNEGNSDSFEVKVGLHQGSVLSPLLFVIVMDIISRGLREGLPWELLYADDLVLMADSEEGVKEKLLNWKMGMEQKGLKVNIGKTKIMAGGEGKGDVEVSGKWPCSVCGKGVARNSLQCTKCLKWVHKKCSGIKGSLQAASITFVCKRCSNKVIEATMVGIGDGVDIGNGDVLEKVGKFCYLGDMINADGGADSAVVARIRCAWKKFRELSPLLTHKGASLKLKGKVYESCVRSCMIYGSETWPMRVEHESKLERAEMRMVRWMCGVLLSERITSKNLRERMGIEEIGIVVRRNRLRWFGHVERKADGDWVKGCTNLKVEGTRPRGRPKKTWMEVVKNDMKIMGLGRKDAQDRGLWRRGIRGDPANPGKPGKRP